jgi:hypothetical protein
MKTHFMVGILAIGFGVLWNITAQTQEVAQPAVITAQHRHKVNSEAIQMVVDSKGKVVGPLIGVLPGGQANLVSLIVNGVGVAVYVSQEGFVDEAVTGGYQTGFTLIYSSSDCSGQPLRQYGDSQDTIPPASPHDQIGGLTPLVQFPLIESFGMGTLPAGTTNIGPYVYKQILYYAAPPFQSGFGPGSASFQYFGDAGVNGNPSASVACDPLLSPPEYAVGNLATFDLSTLGLTPPFHVQ